MAKRITTKQKIEFQILVVPLSSRLPKCNAHPCRAACVIWEDTKATIVVSGSSAVPHIQGLIISQFTLHCGVVSISVVCAQLHGINRYFIKVCYVAIYIQQFERLKSIPGVIKLGLTSRLHNPDDQSNTYMMPSKCHTIVIFLGCAIKPALDPVVTSPIRTLQWT